MSCSVNVVPHDGVLYGYFSQEKMPQAYLSPIVDLHRRDQLFGLAERVVAVESL